MSCGTEISVGVIERRGMIDMVQDILAGKATHTGNTEFGWGTSGGNEKPSTSPKNKQITENEGKGNKVLPL